MVKTSFDEKPSLIFWELTQACDLVCQHCRALAQSDCDPNELKEEEGKRLIDEMAAWKGPMIIFTGGDPLKHASFWPWLEYAREKGVAVSITPSPTPLVTQEAIVRMKQLGVNRLGISLDGGKAETHDTFRGVKGSFERVLEITRQAQEVGLSLQINTTLTRHNLSELESMAALVKQFGAAMWSLFFLVPVGRGENLDLFSPEEHETIYKELYDLSQKYQMAVKTTEAPPYRRYVIQQKQKQEVRGHRMGDGRGIVFVSRIGEVYPSGFLPLSAGNVRESSLKEIYLKSPLFQSLRDPNQFKGKCGRCEFRFVCGGSRARAYALTGDPLESDPYCMYEPSPINSAEKT